MKRSINKDTKEVTGGGFVDVVGINENWTLDSYGFKALDKAGTGKPTLHFNFKNGPMNIRYVEWDIDEKREIENNQKAKADGKSKLTDAEAVQRAVNASDGRLKQILGCFVPDDKISLDADGYAELGAKVVAMLDKYADKEEKLRIKTIYGNDGFLKVSEKNGRFVNLASEPIGDMILKKWELDQIKDNKKSATPSTEEEVASKPKSDSDWD
jgi:hypothetical protein